MLAGGEEAKRCPDCGLELFEEEVAIKMLDSVIVAEDSGALRHKLAEILTERGMAKGVVRCADGSEFITSFMEQHLKDRTPRLAVLDVNMPVINGINAAISLRAIEKGYEFQRPTPILFFTSKQCDETFKKVLSYTKPAKYINKGTGSSPDEFADRLAAVLGRLLTTN